MCGSYKRFIIWRFYKGVTSSQSQYIATLKRSFSSYSSLFCEKLEISVCCGREMNFFSIFYLILRCILSNSYSLLFLFSYSFCCLLQSATTADSHLFFFETTIAGIEKLPIYRPDLTACNCHFCIVFLAGVFT